MSPLILTVLLAAAPKPQAQPPAQPTPCEYAWMNYPAWYAGLQCPNPFPTAPRPVPIQERKIYLDSTSKRY